MSPNEMRIRSYMPSPTAHLSEILNRDSMANNLPPETFELLIDMVTAQDNESFASTRACALVSRSILPLCRKHIFASVTINRQHSGPRSKTTDDLHKLLWRSPRLAVYIRTLVYHLIPLEFVTKPWLPSIFKKLSKLQTLDIRYPTTGSGRGGVDWMIPRAGRRVLLPLLHLPMLTCIKLSGIKNFPLADFAGCVYLRELGIMDLKCSADGAGEFPNTLPSTPVMLDRWEIKGSDIDAARRLCHARRPDGKPIIDLTTVRKLTITLSQLQSISCILETCTELVEVDLCFPLIYRPRSTLEGLFILLESSLLTLRHIGIDIGIDDEHGHDDPLLGLCRELEKLSGQNMVESFRLAIRIGPGNDCKRGDEWSALDDALMTSPKGWPALREVSILIWVGKYHDQHLDTHDDVEHELTSLTKTQFPKLVESEQVKFEFEVVVG